MRRKSVTTQANEREWLESLYNKKRSRSYELGVKAITALFNEGKTVSYRTVALKSKEIDPDGRGIHQNTITNNKELHDYFLQFSTTKAYKALKKSNKPLLVDLEEFKYINQTVTLNVLDNVICS